MRFLLSDFIRRTVALPGTGMPKRWYRISVGCFYFIQGLIFASWASRIPDIKTALGMNEAQLGGVLFFIPVGQLSAMALSGWLVSRFGSKRMLLIGAFIYSMALVTLGMAGSVFQLSAALVFFGMGANLCNISVNTQAVGVERLYGRSIMATFHGLWSLAGFTGGLISTLMVAVHIAPIYHFIMIWFFALLVIASMGRSVLPRDARPAEETRGEAAGRYAEAGDASGADEGSAGAESVGKVTKKPAGKKRVFIKPDRYVIILGCMAFGSMVCEGTMFDWSSVYFEEVIQPRESLVRLGYIAAMCSMAAGRFAADRLITRYGYTLILKCCGAIITLGLLVAVLFPTLWPATLGFLLVGLGVSSIVPVCYSMAGKSKVMLPGVAIATVSTIGFLGFLLGPPVIGFLAHAMDLRWALGIISVMGLVVTMLAPLVGGRKTAK